jgi:hypothetical protein
MTTTPEISTTAVPCIQCGYDLRATPSTGRCPECGMAVSATLAHQRGELFQPRRVLWLVGAFLCWTIALLTLALTYLGAALRMGEGINPNFHFNPLVITYTLMLGAGFFMLVGNVLLAHPLIPYAPTRKRKYLLLTLRLFPLWVLLLILAQMILPPILLQLLRLLATTFTGLHLYNQIPYLLLQIMASLTLASYVLLVAWRLHDLARTAPALQPPALQRILIRLGMITLVLLNVASALLFFNITPLSHDQSPYQRILILQIANLILLGIMAWLQLRRTQTFYRHCQTQWAASLPPKSEPQP